MTGEDSNIPRWLRPQNGGIGHLTEKPQSNDGFQKATEVQNFASNNPPKKSFSEEAKGQTWDMSLQGAYSHLRDLYIKVDEADSVLFDSNTDEYIMCLDDWIHWSSQDKITQHMLVFIGRILNNVPENKPLSTDECDLINFCEALQKALTPQHER